MANTKELKDRIRSVRDTQKITNAMYLIASTKMRKAKSELDKTRPYFDAIKSEIKRIFRTVKDVKSCYFYPDDGEPVLNGTFAHRCRRKPILRAREKCARHDSFAS